MPIRIAESDKDIRACFPVLSQLRPALAEGDLVETVRRMGKAGFRMAFVEEGGAVVSVAGFRTSENLAWGRFLYIDDLVTDEAARSKGHGQRLFDWLVALARSEGCRELHLDSGVQRFGAHRFYLGKRMDITCHHFAMKLA